MSLQSGISRCCFYCRDRWQKSELRAPGAHNGAYIPLIYCLLIRLQGVAALLNSETVYACIAQIYVSVCRNNGGLYLSFP